MIVVLFKDSQLGRYVTRDVETQEDVAHFSPCVQYLDPSRAVWDMKHLNGECGRASNGCPMCIQEKERKDGRERASSQVDTSSWSRWGVPSRRLRELVEASPRFLRGLPGVMVTTCPECLGKYGGPYNHSHTGGTLFDIRFFDCPTCHGIGAVTCERCQGVGRIEKDTGEPARGVNDIILQRTADRARKIAKP